MRGKETTPFTVSRMVRITPAYAGKRANVFTLGSTVQDHPRLCGEKELKDVSGQLKNGITPAYAGKSSGTAVSRRSFKDHPRLCGEKIASPCTVTTWSGSPPPMRGKGHRGEVPAVPFGITPAYAGKSSLSNGQMRSA